VRRPARLAALVVESLLDRVVSGALAEGVTLPNEPALCAEFGVSRTVVREAVKTLEEKGLVKARQGLGTTVLGQDAWNLLDPMVLAAIVRHDDQLAVLDQLISVRSALESQMAGQAARLGTAEQKTSIRDAWDTMAAQVADAVAFAETDVEFHERVMLASGNRLARAIVRTVHGEARTSMRYVGHPSRSDCELSNAQHLAVLEAIEAGDETAASEAMSSHIANAWSRRRPR
jgi:GntR family transcriptional regulator, galactonate operon transcriptional repressor